MVNSINIKRICLIFLILLSCFIISGCINIDYVIDVNENGTEKVTTDVTLPSALEAAGAVDEIKSSMTKAGYYVSSKNDGNNSVVEGTVERSQGNWIVPYPNTLIQGQQPNFTYNYNDYFFYRDYYINASYQLNPQAVQNMLNPQTLQGNPFFNANDVSVNVSYTINLPGKILSTNASATNLNSMKWSLDLKNDSGISLVAKSRLFYPGRIAMAIILLILIVLSGIYLIHRNKYINKPTEEELSSDPKNDIE
jgi:hypothetical protein